MNYSPIDELAVKANSDGIKTTCGYQICNVTLDVKIELSIANYVSK